MSSINMKIYLADIMTSLATRTTFDYIMTSPTNIILPSANITTSSVKHTDVIT